MKRLQSKRAFRHALSTLTVSPGRPPMQISPVARVRTAKSEGLRSDFKNLMGDWERVGQDIICAAKNVSAQDGN